MATQLYTSPVGKLIKLKHKHMQVQIWDLDLFHDV